MRLRSLVTFAAGVLCAAPLHAGLRFEPASGPAGGDVASLAADGTTLWAGTSRGVWRLASGAWSRDGLEDQTILSVAVAGGSVWAATSGEILYRRQADGRWTAEALPVVPPGPTSVASVLLADGAVLYAGGTQRLGTAGVFRWSSGTWSALPSPGASAVTSLAVSAGDLYAGLASGGAARFQGGAWTALAAGILPGETVAALTVQGGAPYAGTVRGLYAWNGSQWVRDAAFGLHDVRALATAGGTLRVATLDAGLFRQNGSAWVADGTGVLPRGGRSFATAGGALYLGTAGGPVYSLAGTAWSDVAPGSLGAAVITEIVTGTRSDPASGDYAVAAAGGGVRSVPASSAGPLAATLPDGCGDVSSLVLSPSGPAGDLLAATSCGPVSGLTAWGVTGSGLPLDARVTTLAALPQGVVGGTTGSGLFTFSGSTWSPDVNGIDPFASVLTLRTVGSTLYAGLLQGLFERKANGAWLDVSDGLPPFTTVAALGGDEATAFAALNFGGVYRRDKGQSWLADATGAGSASFTSLDVSAGRLVAGASTGGVLMKRDGGWGSENTGLPAGADVRVVRTLRQVAAGKPFRHGVLAGTGGSGLFFASTAASVRTVPVVLDLVGGTGARFRTELTIGNRGSSPATARLELSAAPGFGGGQARPEGGSVAVEIAGGTELRIADAIEYLRSKGLTVPAAPVAGSLTVLGDAGGLVGSATNDLYAIARTYTGDASGGTYGLFYDAPSDVDAAEDEGAVFGLRSVADVSRSHLGLVHLPHRSEQPIELTIQVYSDTGVASGSPFTRTLQPGEWGQVNNILAAGGLPEGSFGYVKIRRTSGTGSWSAYGVVNDAATSDGSYLPLYRPGGLASARRLIVPVVLDVYGDRGAHFTTELTLANDSTVATPVDLVYSPAPGFGPTEGPRLATAVSLPARAQLTIDDVLAFFRKQGVAIPDGTSGPQAGTLSVAFRSLTSFDAPRTVALARTTTPGPSAGSGTYGLFYPAIAYGGGSRTSAIVPALTQGSAARSNLAVVHAGGGSSAPLGVTVRLFDATTGVPTGSTLSATLLAGEWKQWSRVLEAAGSSASAAYAVVTRTEGNDSFFAYGVVNDNVTSDGSYVAMIPAAGY